MNMLDTIYTYSANSLNSTIDSKNQAKHLRSKTDETIVIVDQDDLFVKKCFATLKRSGYSQISTTSKFGEAATPIDVHKSAVLIVDIDNVSPFNHFFSTFQVERFRGFRGRLVFTAKTIKFRDLYATAVLEASDFWIKSSALDVAKEVTYLLGRTPRSKKETLCPDAVAELGLFRSAGLTKTERNMIMAMTDGFPRQRELADRCQLSTAYVNKIFSRIYEKLNPTVGVENPAQLAFLITICSMFV